VERDVSGASEAIEKRAEDERGAQMRLTRKEERKGEREKKKEREKKERERERERET
jgi:hypothetical protein